MKCVSLPLGSLFLTVFVLGSVIATCLLTGCGDQGVNNPPAKAPLTIDTQQLAAEINKQLVGQLEKRGVELEKAKLILLVDGIRDQPHRETIHKKAGQLIDTTSGNSSVGMKGGYGDSTHIEISPVPDVEAAAAQIDFGAIIAVDLNERTIVVDAASPRVVRPDDGWPGRAAVRLFIGRKTAAWAAETVKDIAKNAGREKFVVVCYPGSTDKDDWADAINARLEVLAKKLHAEVSTVYTYESQGDMRVAAIGPTSDLQTVADALTGNVLWTDEKLRVIVLERPTGALERATHSGEIQP